MTLLYCGIDYHKRTSTICYLEQNGKTEIKTVESKNLAQELSNKKNLLVGIEASCGVNFIVDRLKAQNIEVKIINPNKFRGIGISGKKTDIKDAQAIAQCLKVGFIPEVFHKSIGSRRIKSLLRIREQHVQNRVKLTNHIRGVLREYGISIALGVEAFEEEINEKLESLDFEPIRHQLQVSLIEARRAKRNEKEVEKELKKLLSGDIRLQQLMSIPGVGLMTAAAILAVGDDFSRFKNSKSFASYIGLTPREDSSGDKKRTGGITKAGQEMLRRYLIHGARTVMRYSNANSKEPLRKWAFKLSQKKGANKATVALAHKIARISFKVITEARIYKKVA
jgi:transposase